MRYLIAGLCALTLAACSPGTSSLQKESRVSDVIYSKRDGFALTLDVFRPEKPNGIGVIWVVSGGWFSNHRDINPGLAKIFTDKGMTVFEVVHGSQPRFKVAEIVQDLNRAVRFIRSNASTYGVDPNRLGICGASAGGHLSLMIATSGGPGKADVPDPIDRASSAVQSVAAFFPPTDMTSWRKADDYAFDLPTLRVFWPAFGMAADTPRDKVLSETKALSPMTFVSAAMPPTFLIHGDADPLVPIYQSQIFEAKLKSLGVKEKLLVVPGKGHGWPGMEKEIGLVADWFLETLAQK